MDAALINAFIQASINVIYQTTGLEGKSGQVYKKEAPYPSDSVVVLIGLTGNIYGSVTINLSEKLACRIASLMMGGMAVLSLEEIAKSAIAELSNMILGNAGIQLSKNNINIDVTPPTILTGKNLQLSVHNSVILCIPLMFEDNESLELNISYDHKKKTI